MNQVAERFERVALSRIHTSPLNPRKHFDEVKLAELADSIKTFGVLQPIVVRPRMHRYELVAGERRYRAAKLADLKTIPCKVVALDDLQVLKIQVIENEQREDVSALEKADGYARLVEEHNVAVEDLAADVGKSVSTIRGLLKIRNLPELARQAVDAGELSMATAQLIGRVPSATNRERLALHVLAGEEYWHDLAIAAGDIEVNRGLGIEALTYRQTKKLVERSLMVELKGAPFATGDKKLLPEAGSCKACPKRVGNLAKVEPEDYAGVRADVCTDPDCYRRKASAHRDQLEAEARAAGCALMPEHAARHLFALDGTLEFGCGWTDLDSIWNPTASAKKHQTYRTAIGGTLRRHIQAAIDRTGKLRYLIPAKMATQELIAGGLLPNPDRKPETNGKPAAGSPEHLADLEERMGLPKGTMEVDQKAARKPSPHAVAMRAASIAGQVLFEMADNNPEGLEGLQALGDSTTNAIWESLKLLCVAAAEDACGGDMAQDLGDQLLTLVNYYGRDDDSKSPMAPFLDWIKKAQPAELIGFLLKWFSLMIFTYPSSPTGHAPKAFLEWGELDWDQLKEQAERELIGGKEVMDERKKNGLPEKGEVHERLGKAAAKNGSKLHAGHAACDTGQEEAVSTKGVCRICKCTEADCRQCIERTGEPCTWADPSKTLCSACKGLLDQNVEDAVELSPKDLKAFNATAIQTVGQLLNLGKTIFFPDAKLMTKARAECLREEAEQWVKDQVSKEQEV